MKAFVAVTDREWFEHLSHAGTLDEVNFWQPSSGNTFQAVRPGEALLFKLHSPDNFIVGGGVFSHWTRLRVSLAWEAFGKNGAENLPEMRRGSYATAAPNRRFRTGNVIADPPFSTNNRRGDLPAEMQIDLAVCAKSHLNTRTAS